MASPFPVVFAFIAARILMSAFTLPLLRNEKENDRKLQALLIYGGSIDFLNHRIRVVQRRTFLAVVRKATT